MRNVFAFIQRFSRLPVGSLWAACFLIALRVLGGCANTTPMQAGPGGSQPSSSRGNAVEPYVIHPGDMLGIKVFGFPRLSQYQAVGFDGKITVHWVGEVHAAGLTPAELDSLLTKVYSEKIVRPELVVIIQSFEGHAVYVGGEVREPGEIPYRGRLSALQAIVSAGGSTEEAKLEAVILVRSLGAENSEIIKLDLSRTLEKGTKDITLMPYDILFIPRTTIAKIDRFVDQYIHSIIPDTFRARLRFNTDIDPKSNEELIKATP